MTVQYKIFCPVCTLSYGIRVQHEPGVTWHSKKNSSRNFWDFDYEPEHAFGFAQEILGGRGAGFGFGMPFAPNEDPTGTYPLVKARILDMLRSWVKRGWLGKDEINGALGVVSQGPPPGPPMPLVFKETPRPPKEEKTVRPVKRKVEKPEKPVRPEKPTRKKKEEELLGPELSKPSKIEKKILKPGIKSTIKPTIKPVVEEKEEKPEFEGEPVRGRLPTGKIYWTDSKGKFIPPERWKDVDGVSDTPRPGMNVTLEELTAYRAELREKQKVVDEAAQTVISKEKAARLKQLEDADKISKVVKPGFWIEDTSGRKWKIVDTKDSATYGVESEMGTKTVLGRAQAVKVIPAPKIQPDILAEIEKPTEAELLKKYGPADTVDPRLKEAWEKSLTETRIKYPLDNSFLLNAAARAGISPEETVMQIAQGVYKERLSVIEEQIYQEELQIMKSEALKPAISNIVFEENVPKTIRNWASKHSDIIENVTAETDEFDGTSYWVYFRKGWIDKESNTHFIHESSLKSLMEHFKSVGKEGKKEEADEELETSVGPNVQPGILASIIPEEKSMITLSNAFKALQDKGILKTTKIAAELAAEELKFRNILTEELQNRRIEGGSGVPGNDPENRRLRVGEVTGFIKRIRR